MTTKRTTMKAQLVGATILAISSSSSAQTSTDVSEKLRISGGARGGSYASLATKLTGLMAGLGHAAESFSSGGGKENVARLMANEADVGFAQADTMMDEGATSLEIIGTLGEECAHLVVADGGNVNDEDDLQSEGKTIAVGAQGSGSQSTWSYMVKLEPGYAESAAQFSGGVRALAKLKTGQFDAVLFVTKPEVYTHKLVDAVNGDPDLEFIDIDDSDLNDKLPNGEPVYRFRDIDTSPRMGGGIETICTPLLVLARPDLPEPVLEDLSDMVLTNAKALQP